jgi:hypothetical protein
MQQKLSFLQRIGATPVRPLIDDEEDDLEESVSSIPQLETLSVRVDILTKQVEMLRQALGVADETESDELVGFNKTEFPPKIQEPIDLGVPLPELGLFLDDRELQAVNRGRRPEKVKPFKS